MKIAENKPKVIRVRLSDTQLDYLTILSEQYGMTISDIIRNLIDQKRVLCRAGESPYANNENNIKHKL